MKHQQLAERPFAWDIGKGRESAPEWPEPTPFRKARPDKGYRHYMIALRIQPHGDLVSFADSLAASLGVPISNSPIPTDRSMFAVMEVTSKSPMKALSGTSFRVDRALKKTGRTVETVAYDVREVTGVYPNEVLP